MDVEMDLDKIEVDFSQEDLKQLDEFLVNDDIDIENLDRVRCFGAPFFPKGQNHHCMCNEVYQQTRNGLKSFGSSVKLVLEEEPRNNLKNISNEKKITPKQAPCRKKSLHLDEFLLELLNTGGNEAHIHWTVKERREFKISRPQRVAALWGDRKCRKLLSDDKLTRALRYSIKKGKLEKTDSQLMLYRFPQQKLK